MTRIPDPRRLLAFWHQLEFFLPYALDDQLDDNCGFFGSHELAGNSDASALWHREAPAGKKLSSFQLFLGVFPVEESERILSTHLASALDPREEEEARQRQQPGRHGLSCMASLQLDPLGRPQWDRTSISTLPWALGQLIRSGSPHGLDFDAYLDAEETLKLRLESFRGRRQAPVEGEKPPLAPGEILELVELVLEWSGFRPQRWDPTHRLVAIQPRFAPEKPADRAGDDNEVEIDILNSFFARDLARVLLAYRHDENLGAAGAYLKPLADEQRHNLYDGAAEELLFKGLMPGELPWGRWPAEDHHGLSLMQQFAVNQGLRRLQETTGGIFSVNGPPGTGKTTLLRDFVADLLVQRASRLARYKQPDDAFTDTEVLFQDDGKVRNLRQLQPELTGFEMVVVSANNKAVENVSRDLPRAQALGRSSWRDLEGNPRLEYLRPVACNIAARQGDGRYRSLDPDQMPWGLIAGVLGRKKNRQAFADGLLFPPKNSPPAPYDPDLHQTLWQWLRRRSPSSPDYATVRQRFLRLQEQVRERRRLRQMQASHLLNRHAITQHRRELEALNRELQLAEALRPGFWIRWFTAEGRAQYRTYRQQKRRNRARYHRCFTRLQKAEETLRELEREAGGEKGLQAIEEKLPPLDLPLEAGELNQPRWQIEGLARDPVLDRLRAELFAAALQLHEAWLAEAHWRDNLLSFKQLLLGNGRLTRDQAKLLWQSFFMVVPVVSSTLASVATLFRELRGGDLGWLFIDEAGQAPPQQAVGALWRAQRAVVVGDPLQIEPVFTVPLEVTKKLAETNGIREEDGVSPHQISVQVLADAANPLGATLEVEGEKYWLGSPLRVHRRCQSPMFDIANAIAYGGTMIQAVPEPDADAPFSLGGIDPGQSGWVDQGGRRQGRHTVQAQLQLVTAALLAWKDAGGSLPPLFIIAPFREIAANLKQRLAAEGLEKGWLDQHVGTVHTFQGKEEEVVWFVLGCDASTPGATAWAASKPNLLNVAATRARKRFFIIGEHALWAGLPHFSEAARLLPEITPAAFLNRFAMAGGRQAHPD